MSVSIVIERSVIDQIETECDRYDDLETGGRLIGVYQYSVAGDLSIRVLYQIDAGPGARRTRTSLFQDGEYQESVFRKVERKITNIEDLGSWHTHHVNGLQTLSQGDVETYQRTVNSPNHNTDFFYALLVTSKNIPDGYNLKHFLLFRNSSGVHQMSNFSVRIE